jgi:hypothetical protein
MLYLLALRHAGALTAVGSLQLKPKKTAVVEATPTVGMSIEAFSKVCLIV